MFIISPLVYYSSLSQVIITIELQPLKTDYFNPEVTIWSELKFLTITGELLS